MLFRGGLSVFRSRGVRLGCCCFVLVDFLTFAQICPLELGECTFGVVVVCIAGFFKIFFNAFASTLLGFLGYG
jgi:hypothetical protein